MWQGDGALMQQVASAVMMMMRWYALVAQVASADVKRWWRPLSLDGGPGAWIALLPQMLPYLSSAWDLVS